MNIISKNTEYELIIKKSKFICKLYYTETEEEINSILEILRKEYKDATHICYTYILPNKQKAFDDGEPSGTAALPMLELLKKKDLTNILCVVIRYFGGIKLGAGGLIRAYSNSVKETLENIEVIPYKKYTIVTLKANYDEQKTLDNLTKDYEIISKSYDNLITYIIKIEENETEILKQIIKSTNITMVLPKVWV